MTLPPRCRLGGRCWAAAFAICFGKMVFGGLGFNLFNPALIGRAFLMATLPLAMTSGWTAPRPWFGAPLDAVTTATPLAALREHGLAAAMRSLRAGRESRGSGCVLGFRPGSIGEVSVLLLGARRRRAAGPRASSR